MFLICPAKNFLVDKNRVKYGIHTKILPQEGYGTRVLTSDACGMRRHLRCSRCTAFFEQSIPVWNRLYEVSTNSFLNKIFQFGIDCHILHT